MNSITAFFDKLDFSKLVPQMDTLLEKLQTIAGLALMIGPLVMLAFGLWFFFLPPKEANHKAGFRTWFGMGSVAAWRYTQRLAGIVWGGLGLVLTIVMLILRGRLAQLEPLEMLYTTITYLLWQAGAALLSYIGICLTVTLSFDRKGNRRRM